VLTIGIAMLILVNYDSEGPVLIGSAMQNPVKNEDQAATSACAVQHTENYRGAIICANGLSIFYARKLLGRTIKTKSKRSS